VEKRAFYRFSQVKELQNFCFATVSQIFIGVTNADRPKGWNIRLPL
jgi:hypothetical protein